MPIVDSITIGMERIHAFISETVTKSKVEVLGVEQVRIKQVFRLVYHADDGIPGVVGSTEALGKLGVPLVVFFTTLG